MRRAAGVLLGAGLLAVILIPPWRLAWTSTPQGPGPGMSQATWAGFHSWAYAKERPTTVIAWDGPGTGGHVPLTGAPRVAYDVWAGLLLLSAAGLYVVTQRPHAASRPQSPGDGDS